MDLQTRIARLSPEKRRLLKLRLQHSGQASPVPDDLPPLVSRPDERYRPFPLTDVQEAYWIGRQDTFELGNVAAHGYTEIDCRLLDLERLECAWQRLIARHDMLRAVLLADGRQQVLEKAPDYQIVVHDLRGSPPAFQEQELATLRHTLSHQCLPADRWPLFELHATRLDEERTRLHLSLDVLIFDAWSLSILSHEWQQLYADLDYPLPSLGLTYRDYVLAEERLRDSELYRRSETYWRDRVAEFPPPPELPLTVAPSSIRQPRFQRHSGRLEPALWQCLRDRSGRLGITPSVAVLAAYAEVLAAWSKHPHFTINLSLFNRLPLHPQVDLIVGDFTSLLLVPIQRQPGQDFGSRAQDIQRQLWRDLDHRYFSGVRVLRELARHHRSGNQALMPVVFTSALGYNLPGGQSTPLSWLGKEVYTLTQTPQVWLDHQIGEDNGSLVFDWDAVVDLFPEDVLGSMFTAFQSLLERLARDDSAWQARVLALTPPSQLAQRWESERVEEIGQEQLLFSPFLAQAARHPDRLAVWTTEREFSYGELYRRSRQLAGLLRGHGVQPNQLVAVVMRKSWGQVVAVLGILQAGAAYLPVDADLPQERQHYLLERGQVRVAVTQAALLTELHWPPDVFPLAVDDGGCEGCDAPPLAPLQGCDDLAYVIFTSGSTGLPKGVMISHRGAMNTLADINRRFRVGSADRVLALSSLSFDLSVYDLFGLLMVGGAIVLPDPAAQREPAHWAAQLAAAGVTVWNSVPALLDMLSTHLHSQGKQLPPSLRLALLSGDWIPLNLPERVRVLSPALRLISLGGATEVSIWSVWYPIEQVDPAWRSIPYGKALTNQTIQVLDRDLMPRPDGVVGEIYIGGIGLAEGYWREPEKTAAAFIQHPDSGKRLYRTGDLGRYLPDGNIEFLGREDFQVKIRGHRIELGEIEYALNQHPQVQTAVVDAVGTTPAEKRLVAYVVPAPAEDGADGVILDPLQRLEFRLRRPGLRRLPASEKALPLPRPLPDPSAAQYAHRRSERHYTAAAVTMEQLGALLSNLAFREENGIPRYRYGSAGGLYPVQTYLYVKPGRVTGLAAGTYYYHPGEHALVPLDTDVRLDRSIYDPANQPLFEGAAFVLFLIAKTGAIAPLYGAAAQDFCLIEAGLVCQLLEQEAPCHELGLCQIGAFEFAPLRAAFQLDTDHRYLHSLVGGIPAPTPVVGSVREAAEQGAGVLGMQAGLPARLQSYLRERLPDYMVPATILLLQNLPLSANGKVDRRALQVLETRPAETQGQFHEPRSALEQSIATVWQEVLGIGRVGIHDTFFSLGGDSVQMVQVHGRLQPILEREISLVDMFFRFPTIAALVEHLSAESDTAGAAGAAQERAVRRREGERQQRHIRLAQRHSIQQPSGAKS